MLHSSWRALLSGAFGGFVVAAAGVYSTVATSAAVGSLIILVIGLCILFVVFVDFPLSSAFDRDGVTRRPVLRRHRITWDRVDQLTRTRPGLSLSARSLAPGGLVAKVGRRRYLLVDQCESLDEYAALSDLLAEHDEAIAFHDLIVPPSDTDPTWTYRRRRWQPQSD